MQKLPAFLLFVLSGFIIHAQSKTNDLVSNNLKGYVRSVNEITFEAITKFGDVTKGEKSGREYYEFNKSGFTTENLMIDYEDDTEWSIKYIYDSRNNLIEIRENEDGEIEISKRKYDGQGNITEDNTYDKKGNLTGKSKFIYNPSGQLIKVNEYDAEGKLILATEKKYNDKSWLVSSLSYDEARKLLYSTYYKYDTGGNVIEDISAFRNRKGVMDETTRTFSFNGKKEKTMESYSASGSNPTKTTYAYDSRGNLAVEKDSYNNSITYEYIYDQQNNWIKRIKSGLSFGSASFEISEREIKYYEEKDIPADARIKVKSKVEDIEKWYGDLDIYWPEEENDEFTMAGLNKQSGAAIPGYKVFTSNGTIVSLVNYIEINRRFKEKPTLLVTWSNEWCQICVRKIDTILNNGLVLKYNIVLVNKESADRDFSKLKENISNHTPDFSKDVILLFDKNNELSPLDKNGAPFFLWMDKDLKMIYDYPGYAINVKAITNFLKEME